jgi:SAM-dependent methyltransferase
MKRDRRPGDHTKKRSLREGVNRKKPGNFLRKEDSGRKKMQPQGPSRAHSPLVQPGISSRLTDLIDSYIREKTGKDSADPVFLERLRQSVMAQKASYWHDKPGKSVKYGKAYDIFAYLSYHLPVYCTQFRSIIQDLEKGKILPGDLVVLDIGTGPGVVPLALIDFWKGGMKKSLEIFSVERSEEHREAFRALVQGFAGLDPGITIHDPVAGDLVRLSAEGHPDLPRMVNLLTFQNVLAELEHLSTGKKAEIVRSYANRLDNDGIIIIVEPAEMRHATTLRLLQRELMRGELYVYAPCSYLWGSGCDPSSCWTFQEEPSIPPTPLMNRLAGEDEGYRFLNTDIKYSYLVLTKKSLTRTRYRIPRQTRMIRLSQLERYNRRIIDVTAALMSRDIGKRGMHIFKICDGTCREPVYAVLSERNRREEHQALFTTAYGQIMEFFHVQVRRHQIHQAWNIIIGPDSRIEPVDNQSQAMK